VCRATEPNLFVARLMLVISRQASAAGRLGHTAGVSTLMVPESLINVDSCFDTNYKAAADRPDRRGRDTLVL
jgi:hypothetical protein